MALERQRARAHQRLLLLLPARKRNCQLRQSRGDDEGADYCFGLLSPCCTLQRLLDTAACASSYTTRHVTSALLDDGAAATDDSGGKLCCFCDAIKHTGDARQRHFLSGV